MSLYDAGIILFREEIEHRIHALPCDLSEKILCCAMRIKKTSF